MRATNIKRWRKVKLILKKKVTIMTLKMAKRKVVTMIVTFFKIISLIKNRRSILLFQFCQNNRMDHQQCVYFELFGILLYFVACLAF